MAMADNFDPARDMRAKKRRSVAIALVLAGLVLLFFLMTIVRLGGDVVHFFD
ncbi:MAG TPA: hypothetical protein VMH86_17260 [Rhizomicrobium sp.]|nr:hypothetical protein [Rhizomicrobium sp.]